MLSIIGPTRDTSNEETRFICDKFVRRETEKRMIAAVILATTDEGIIPKTSRLKLTLALFNKHFFLQKCYTEYLILLIISLYCQINWRCRSSYKVFSDLLRKQYTKQQNNGP